MNTIHFIIYSCAVILLAFCYCFLGECLISEVIIEEERNAYIFISISSCRLEDTRTLFIRRRTISADVLILHLSEQRSASGLLFHELVRSARTVCTIFDILHCSIAKAIVSHCWQVLRVFFGDVRRCKLLFDRNITTDIV